MIIRLDLNDFFESINGFLIIALKLTKKTEQEVKKSGTKILIASL
jgi:hypothetical protein